MKPLYRWSLIVAAVAATGCAGEREPTLAIVVETEAGFPSGDTLFVAGNVESIGAWRPDGLALSTLDSTTWRAEVRVAPGSTIEFKITRGTWPSEALAPDGTVPQNHVVRVVRDTVVHVTVPGWKDISGPSPGQITGRVDYLRGLKGDGIPDRDVAVRLPAGYADEMDRRYPVLYVHDGQNVFDPTTSFTGVDWQIDEHEDSLSSSGRMEHIIVVAIDNTPARREEYDDTEAGRAYLEFIVNRLKPRIDAAYRTRPDAGNTAIMGSSMGGTISFLALWRHPDVFSKAACLSPYFPPDLPERVSGSDWDTAGLSLYIDNGDDELDDRLQRGIDAMLPVLRRAGFEDGRNMIWYRSYGDEHNEQAWARRVWRPLLYFFGDTSDGVSR